MAEQEAANARRKEVIVAVTPKKRSHDGESRPLAVGAHGLARQDGGDTQTGTHFPLCGWLSMANYCQGIAVTDISFHQQPLHLPYLLQFHSLHDHLL